MKKINIGFHCSGYSPTIFIILWALRDKKIKSNLGSGKLFGEHILGRYFEIEDDNYCYKFSTEYADLNGTDKKINLKVNDDLIYDVDKYDLHIFSTHDVLLNQTTDEMVVKFCDTGNVILTQCRSDVRHENFLTTTLSPLIYFYYYLGYHYLNFYQMPSDFNNLLGCYHRHNHNSGGPNHSRNKIANKVHEILEDDFFIYERPTSDFYELLGSMRYFNLWQQVHSSTYIDYKTSVCNLLFESFSPYHEHISWGRALLSEKTMKAILFSGEDIFFIWSGTHFYYETLTDYGFWFLNSEFYGKNKVTEEAGNPLVQSIYDAVNYLKELKEVYGTNDKVHAILMEQYGHKLKNNIRLFKQLEENCPYKDYILDAIHNKKTNK